MRFQDFERLTPRQFFNAVKGFRKREETLSNERLLIARKIMWATAAPHCKDLKEKDFFELDFIDNVSNKKSLEETLAIVEEAKKVKAFFEDLDKRRKNQTA